MNSVNNMQICNYGTIGGQKITTIYAAVEITEQTKPANIHLTQSPEYRLFETQKRSTRKSVLKQIVKKENDLGIRH